MAGALVESDLQGIVAAVSHALVEPLLQHVGVRPPGLDIARSRRRSIHDRTPIQMPADGTDVVDIENGIRW